MRENLFGECFMSRGTSPGAFLRGPPVSLPTARRRLYFEGMDG